MLATTAASVSSRRRHSAFNQVLESLEARRLLATVAPGFNADVLYGSNFSNGTAMDFSPDGRLWATTQTGSVFVIQPGGASPATLALSIPVDSFFERGLLGIAFDPAFDSTAPGVDHVYFYYTRPAGAEPVHNRVVRFEVNGNTIDPASETLILRLNNLSAGNHNGGAIHFGPDNKLYVAVGENANSGNAQTVGNLLGKMLRIDPAAYDPADPLAVIPSDNPTSFPGIAASPAGQNRAIWAVGLRNPYTFAFQPGTGRMHINDVGQSTFEEIDHGQAGLNYGWPMTEGPNPPGNPVVTYPIHAYPRSQGTTIVGGAFYNTPAHTFPAEYAGDYFFADLTGAGAHWIRRLDAANAYQLQTTGGVSNGTNFLQGGSNIVDVKVGPDGGLYFLQRGNGNFGQGVRVVRATDPSPYVSQSSFVFNGFTQPQPPHRLRFTFTEDVSSSIGPDDLTVENLTTSTTIPTGSIAMIYEPATNTAVFAFPGLPNGILPDGRYRATLTGSGITGPTGQAVGGNPVLNFFFLNGDANRDARVNLDDFNIVAGNFGQSPRDFTQGDFNYDGTVNLEDFNILAGRFGQMVAPAATTAAPTFGTTEIGDADREDEKDELLA